MIEEMCVPNPFQVINGTACEMATVRLRVMAIDTSAKDVMYLYRFVGSSVSLCAGLVLITPRRGIVFGRFASFFVSLSATLRENGWTDLHKIFREGVE